MDDEPQSAPARPPVAIVMPFAGTPADAAQALATLDGLTAQLHAGDVVVLADNSGTAPACDPRVRPAPGEPSPARARNAGAAAAFGPEWLLFLDADAEPDPGLLDAFFAAPIAADVAAVAGEIAAVETGPGAPLAARYGAARNFLNSDVHMRHPFRPRVAAANLLVRRAAFDAVGGFQEGVRAAEDTDFCWRLQDAGWRLEVRPTAVVRHAYRPSLGGLRAQWRGYAAGRAWLARRYPGFVPQPALWRAVRRLDRRRVSDLPVSQDETAHLGPADAPAGLRPAESALIDVVLGLEELVGLALPNRPGTSGPRPRTVIVAEMARPPDAIAPGTSVEAPARPPGPVAICGAAPIDYREDDSPLERLAATARLVLTRPRAVLADRTARAGGPPLSALAPVVRRIGDAEITATEDPASQRLAARLRALR